MKTEDSMVTAARPSDWPCNERERRLDILIKAFDDFIDNPTFATKEVLVKEHRYVFFTYAKQEFINAVIDGNFFKVETALYMFPEFILGENPARAELRCRSDEKRIRTSFRDYVFCQDCLMRDDDLAVTGKYAGRCPICGSANVILMRPNS